MKKFVTSAITGTLLATAAASAFSNASNETGVHWSYDGKTDPTHWADGVPENAACRCGQRQSPIALSETSAKRVAGKDFALHYKPGSVALLNNGHTVQANVGDADDPRKCSKAAVGSLWVYADSVRSSYFERWSSQIPQLCRRTGHDFRKELR